MSMQGPRSDADGTASPATSSAELRRRLDAHERSARRLEVPVAVAIGVLGLVTVAGGVTHPGLLAVGAWLVTLAVLVLWARSVRNRTERGTGPRGPSPRLTTLNGEPATAVTAPATRLVVTLAMWLLVAVPLLGGGLALLVGDAPGAGALLLGAGVVALMPVALVVVGRVSPGGVWLTPSAVVVRDHGLESRIPWPALVTVADDATTDATRGTVLLRADAAAGTIHRHRSGPWARSVRTVGPAIALIDARWLALDAQAIARVLRHYHRSGTAGELGSPASLRTISDLAADRP